MEYRRSGEMIILRLDKGEEVVSSLIELAQREKIRTANISGIGALSETIMGCFNGERKEFVGKEYRGDLELLSLLGNITVKDGEPYIHLHIAIADETGMTFGGHLKSAIIGMTGEFFVQICDLSVDRRFDDSLGINVFKYNNR